MSLVLLVLGACNRAPVDYNGDERAPRAFAPWGHPSEDVCARQEDSDDDRVVDGFTFCQFEDALLAKWPVDDPIFETCDEVASSVLAVMYVTDGIRARAYAIDELLDREVVNDRWGDEPLLVDY